MNTLEEIIKRIKRKTLEKDGCWLFLGAKNYGGYGVVKFDNKTVLVHRISAAYYLNLNLSDPTEYASHIDEKCSNKNCWQPEHLYIGDVQENTKDSMRIGTHSSLNQPLKTHCKRGHEFTEENTYIRRDGLGKECRICRYESVKLHRGR